MKSCRSLSQEVEKFAGLSQEYAVLPQEDKKFAGILSIKRTEAYNDTLKENFIIIFPNDIKIT